MFDACNVPPLTAEQKAAHKDNVTQQRWNAFYRGFSIRLDGKRTRGLSDENVSLFSLPSMRSASR